MFNIENAKEINIKQNDDGTYNMTVKIDLYDGETSSIVMDVMFDYPRVKIELNVDVLADNDDVCTMTTIDTK